jgi:hypothetical protein
VSLSDDFVPLARAPFAIKCLSHIRG